MLEVNEEVGEGLAELEGKTRPQMVVPVEKQEAALPRLPLQVGAPALQKAHNNAMVLAVR